MFQQSCRLTHLHEPLLLSACAWVCCCLVSLWLQVGQTLTQLRHHALRELAHLLNLRSNSNSWNSDGKVTGHQEKYI
jgi:hypothetical protein